MNLQSFAHNVHSQSGEDGLLAEILQRLPETPAWAVEFGAWDGKTFSNSYHLIQHRHFSAVMIEASPEKFKELQRTFVDQPQVHCVREFVTFQGDTSLDSILARTPLPRDFGVLSIDIDGADYHVWDSLRHYEPRIVVIEFNPSLPNDVGFIQPADMSVHQGSSLFALNGLAQKKGYELAAVTDLNAVFVRRQDFAALKIDDNSLAALRPHNPFETRLYQLYDGTLILDGCQRLIWDGVPLAHEKLQMLPRWLRVSKTLGASGLRKFLKRLYLSYLKWRYGKTA
jgi:hypothetical protein